MSPKDNSLKVFDVANFDMMHMIKLKFSPELCEFVHRSSAFSALLAVTQVEAAVVHIIKAETAEGQVLKVLKDLHFAMIRTIKYVPQLNLVVSSDQSGMIEIWDPETFELPESLDFNLVIDTDLLEIAKSKTFALSCAASNTGEFMAFYTRDRKIRVFSIKSGKLLRTIDDSLQQYIDY